MSEEELDKLEFTVFSVTQENEYLIEVNYDLEEENKEFKFLDELSKLREQVKTLEAEKQKMGEELSKCEEDIKKYQDTTRELITERDELKKLISQLGKYIYMN